MNFSPCSSGWAACRRSSPARLLLSGSPHRIRLLSAMSASVMSGVVLHAGFAAELLPPVLDGVLHFRCRPMRRSARCRCVPVGRTIRKESRKASSIGPCNAVHVCAARVCRIQPDRRAIRSASLRKCGDPGAVGLHRRRLNLIPVDPHRRPLRVVQRATATGHRQPQGRDVGRCHLHRVARRRSRRRPERAPSASPGRRVAPKDTRL